MIRAFSHLKDLRQWVCWKQVTSNGKPRKLPINPHTGKCAKVDDPITWGTYDEAVKGHRRYRTTGLGFVFTKQSGVVGIDLDNVISESGETDPYALDLIKRLNSYTELSPSGRGYHILCYGKIPQSLKSPLIEIYNEKRYFTVTGELVDGCLDSIERRDRQVMSVYNQYSENTEKVSVEEVRDALSYIPAITDYNDEWLRILMAVHSEFPDSTGIQLIEEWSPGYPNEVSKKFRSFKKNGVGIGTLFYIASQYGWKRSDPLDTIYPPLTRGQRVQVQRVIQELAEEMAWEKYHAMLERDHLSELGIDRIQADHFRFGYVDNWRNHANLFSIPYWNSDGEVVNIEYVTKQWDVVGYEVDVPQLYYTLPFTPVQENPETGFVFQAPMTAINSYKLHGNIEVAGGYVGFWGCPQRQIATAEDMSDLNRVYIFLNPDEDVRRYEAFKEFGRFIIMPIDVLTAIESLSTREINRLLVTAQSYEHVL